MKYTNILKDLKDFLSGRFNLLEDNASQDEIHDRIEGGVVIRGINLWVLIFATFIASIGLNMNSTAVIIGAMLISPLMGPILGMGLALGVNDFDLLKRSAKNFSFMTIIAILTSTIYFMISPWTEAQSEILSRTQPTTWDVFVAFFGGLAGIVAQTRKNNNSTVIPGVAIATALMPPLCTAGYGLATGQFNFFFGAFYLFIINTVFIAIAAFIITNSMQFDKKVFVDPVKETKVKRIMASFVIVLIVPSVIIGYRLVREMVFQQNASKYVKEIFVFEETRVVDRKIRYSSKSTAPSTIEIFLYGKPLEAETMEMVKVQMAKYDLTNTILNIRQSDNTSGGMSEFIQNNFQQLLDEKNDKIATLTEQVNNLRSRFIPNAELSRELAVLLGRDVHIAISRTSIYNSEGESGDAILLCYVTQTESALSKNEINKITRWLRVRTETPNVKVIDNYTVDETKE